MNLKQNNKTDMKWKLGQLPFIKNVWPQELIFTDRCKWKTDIKGYGDLNQT